MSDSEGDAPLPAQVVEGAEALSEEPPVVARLVVEIRSDGTRTIARGAMEDHLNGESMGVEARADSPLELASALAKLIFRTPSMAARVIGTQAMETGGGPRRGRKRRAIARAIRRRLSPDDDSSSR